MTFNILTYTREQAYAYAQQGGLNIKSGQHWDICKALSDGKTIEVVADDFRVHYQTVKQIKRCKCPDV